MNHRGRARGNGSEMILRNRPEADALVMRAGYAVTRAAYRPQAWRGRSRIEGSARSSTARHPSWWFAVSVVDDDCRHARGGNTVDQVIGFLHTVAGPVASDMDAIVAD
ncbi:hypothetical protein OY671_008146, partial [Metschnikowia pulcherrima]